MGPAVSVPMLIVRSIYELESRFSDLANREPFEGHYFTDLQRIVDVFNINTQRVNPACFHSYFNKFSVRVDRVFLDLYWNRIKCESRLNFVDENCLKVVDQILEFDPEKTVVGVFSHV